MVINKNKKTFTKNFTAKIAALSKLKLTESELDYFTNQFNSTIETISTLNEVDVSKTREAYNITGLKNVWREDEIDKKRIFSQKEALSNAKRVNKGFFIVKGIFDIES